MVVVPLLMTDVLSDVGVTPLFVDESKDDRFPPSPTGDNDVSDLVLYCFQFKILFLNLPYRRDCLCIGTPFLTLCICVTLYFNGKNIHFLPVNTR